MVASQIFMLLLLTSAVYCALAGSHGSPSLRRGSFQSVENQNDILVSANGVFSSGFYKVGDNAYCYAIWFTESAEKTVVWMANRDRPVNGKRSRLSLLRNGNLVLTDADGSIVWSTSTFSDARVEAELLETGNLVLREEKKEKYIWESFGFPTDTLLPIQELTKNTTLVSATTKGTYFSGFYNFKYDDNNVLNIIYKGPAISSVYWPNTSSTVFANGRTPYNCTRIAVLDQIGRFQSSDSLFFNTSDYGIGLNRRLTLDYDGIVRSYSLKEPSGLWEVSWVGVAAACKVHGLCGVNGVCRYEPQLSCACPNGFTRNDPSDWSKGCAASFNLTCNGEEEFMELQNTDFFGYDLETYALGVSFEHCRNACLNDCKCVGFGYALDGLGQCYPKGILLNGFQMPDSISIIHVKVPRGFLKSNPVLAMQETDGLNCSAEETVLTEFGASAEKVLSPPKTQLLKYLLGIVVSIAIFEVTCIALGWWFVFRKHTDDEVVNLGYMILAMGFKRFTYKELKKATKNFKHEVGRGGFGTVYKGVLENGIVVAVKRLEGVLQGDAEFWAEVTTIGKINHRNLVKLWGFCVENGHKLLIYEFLENGSLDKILFSGSSGRLGWNQRYSIALGTAKGLSYLHEECLEWVLHCDVKSQNILLDDDLEPKVADFGMSMLFKDSDSKGFSKVRGTRGYLAPEWMMNSRIDAKADVYSYGMVLLELLSGKSAYAFQTAAAPDNNLVQWVRQKVEQKRLDQVIDTKMLDEYNEEKLEKLVKVAMLCVQEDPGLRPSMGKVVELLIRCGEENGEA